MQWGTRSLIQTGWLCYDVPLHHMNMSHPLFVGTGGIRGRGGPTEMKGSLIQNSFVNGGLWPPNDMSQADYIEFLIMTQPTVIHCYMSSSIENHSHWTSIHVHESFPIYFQKTLPNKIKIKVGFYSWMVLLWNTWWNQFSDRRRQMTTENHMERIH